MIGSLGISAIWASTQALDGITTYFALTHGAKEGNPILVTFGLSKRPGLLLAVKLAVAFGFAAMIPWLNNPPYLPGSITTLAVSALTGYVAIHNLAELISHKIL